MNIVKTQVQIVLALFLISASMVFLDYVISGYDNSPKIKTSVNTKETKNNDKIAVVKTTNTQPKPAVQQVAKTPVAQKPAPAPAVQKTTETTVKKVQPVNNTKPVPVSTKGKNEVKEDIVKHSIDMNVDPAIALAIAKIESNFDHSKRSANGAVGVFQILPSTARSMGYDAYSANDNIKSGITYYKKMYQKFGDVDLALAAYNAGPGNVSRYNGVPPFAETKRFINKIKNEYENQKNDPILGKYQNRQM